MSDERTRRERVGLVLDAARYDTSTFVVIVVGSLLTALLEGVGMSFILPVVELTSGGAAGTEGGGQLLSGFARVYEFIGVPLTLGPVVVGVTIVMAARFAVSFGVQWLRAIHLTGFVRDLRARAFDSVLAARIEEVDDRGSDELLNSIITQTGYNSTVLNGAITLVQQSLFVVVYLAIALYLAPVLTVVTITALAVLTTVIQGVLRPAYAAGDEMAQANEALQNRTQQGIMGIRDVKLFAMREAVSDRFREAIDRQRGSAITLARTKALLSTLYLFSSAVVIFALIYLALEVYQLSVGALAVFLFAVLRLAPLVRSLNQLVYSIDSELPHLVRTRSTIERLERDAEPIGTGDELDRLDRVEFDDVWFEYPDGTAVARGVNFSVTRGETVAFVGQSGAGKSTLVSLLTRLYEPTRGAVTGNGRDAGEYDIESWRRRIAVVRQDPFLFDETLRFNLTIGRPTATDAEIREACETAMVSEFLPTLPNGLETVLGENGVRLSGGQRQRVALARALLTDGDVLVLDEATSHLDPETERQVLTRLDEHDRSYLTILIAHRLSTVVGADRIHAMRRGRVVETGTHEELLQNGETYATLYRGNVES